MASLKEELKRPIDWKSLVLITIAILGFGRGCANDVISDHPDVKKIQLLEQTTKTLVETAEKLDNSVRNLDVTVATLKAIQEVSQK